MTQKNNMAAMTEMLSQFNQLVEKLLTEESKQGVAPFVPTDDLDTNLDLGLQEEGAGLEVFNKALEQLVLSTPRTGTSLFFNQLFGGRKPDSVLGDLLAVLLNNSMYTYKVAGPQIGIEKTILKEIIGLIGFGENADGTFAPGGSMTILELMQMLLLGSLN